MKGLILCAGKGSRLYPFTITYPKTLIPVANEPLLHGCIDKLIEQNISEIGIVIHPSQEAVIKESLQRISRWNINITYIYQNQPLGIANALLQGQDFIGQDSFILLLGDNLISTPLTKLKEQVEQQGNHAALLLAEVENPQDYGIAEVEQDKIVKLEEKPKTPKSNLAVLGAYVFSSMIFKACQEVKPSARGEYEITDAIQWLIQNSYPVSYHEAEISNIDVGTIERWIEANRKVLKEMPGENHIHSSVTVKNSKIIPPVSIAQGSIIEDSVIGPYVSIGEGSTIQDCTIEDSILLSHVHLKQLTHPMIKMVVGSGSALTGTKAKGGEQG
ncbi:sugar phosphate nucleotidyltransferase [Neobacillus mesonae]|nr:sugar phosphate nucleotidyltransferase [Neobacillus mesonae]